MDGEFLVEDSLGVEKGVAGGNLIIEGMICRRRGRRAVRGRKPYAICPE